MTSYGLLSTYPPTLCGLATFTHSLAVELQALGAEVRIVRSLEAAEAAGPELAEVTAHLVAGDASSRATSVRTLNSCDIAIVQHEYGIYGGRDGDEVLEVLAALAVPSVVVAHTVLEHPTPHQREVLERCAQLAGSLVVMSQRAHDLLESGYDVDLERVVVIPHGVHFGHTKRAARGRSRILTWGLLGPGKGIEWGIAALAAFAEHARPEYVIAGETHPKVKAEFGESYRRSLQSLAAQSGVDAHVQFIDEYLDADSLSRLIATADVVLLPYDSREQVTSGVLVDALAAGKPVVATDFPHAVELLSGGAGLIVPHRNPLAIADGLRTVLDDPRRAAGMAAAAGRLSLGSGWGDVAKTYERLARRILSARAA
jgi:glycosyltransferase involved in cell wall biosynthesis